MSFLLSPYSLILEFFNVKKFLVLYCDFASASNSLRCKLSYVWPFFTCFLLFVFSSFCLWFCCFIFLLFLDYLRLGLLCLYFLYDLCYLIFVRFSYSLSFLFSNCVPPIFCVINTNINITCLLFKYLLFNWFLPSAIVSLLEALGVSLYFWYLMGIAISRTYVFDTFPDKLTLFRMGEGQKAPPSPSLPVFPL